MSIGGTGPGVDPSLWTHKWEGSDQNSANYKTGMDYSKISLGKTRSYCDSDSRQLVGIKDGRVTLIPRDEASNADTGLRKVSKTLNESLSHVINDTANPKSKDHLENLKNNITKINDKINKYNESWEKWGWVGTFFTVKNIDTSVLTKQIEQKTKEENLQREQERKAENFRQNLNAIDKLPINSTEQLTEFHKLYNDPNTSVDGKKQLLAVYSKKVQEILRNPESLQKFLSNFEKKPEILEIVANLIGEELGARIAYNNKDEDTPIYELHNQGIKDIERMNLKNDIKDPLKVGLRTALYENSYASYTKEDVTPIIREKIAKAVIDIGQRQ